jgi:putative ATP-dependent endonuclease of OLD family
VHTEDALFIRSLTIDRFRGLEHLAWRPPGRVNCLIGPGDAGKSTILAAIELVLDPRASPSTSEYDYYRRRVEDGFAITAVLGDLDDDVVSAMRTPPLHGWRENGLTALPDEDGTEAVLVARVTGSPDLELSHILVAPGDAGEIPFTVAQRRLLLLSRVASGSRASTEFRLGRGTLLDRHTGGTTLRPALRAAVADASADLVLPPEAGKALARLRTLFAEAGLPDDLHLSIITPQGMSLLTLVGLLEGDTAEAAVPLTLAGAGTRQLALFRLAAALMEGAPVVLLDEPELGLEPYRQRRLVVEIRSAIGEHGQAFLTTHSPAVLEALQAGEVSRLPIGENPIVLDGEHVARVQSQAPDALLSRLPTLCEGDTEAGLLRPILDAMTAEDGLPDIDALGIRLVARKGQPQVLSEAEQFLNAGLHCGLFVDNETTYPGRRGALVGRDGCALGTWTGVRNIEEAVATWLPWDQLPRVLDLAARLRDRPVEDLLQQIGDCIGKPGKNTLDDLRAHFDQPTIRGAVANAMQSKGSAWFKTVDGGEALGVLLLELGLPPELDTVFREFWTQVRQESGWA